MRSRRIKRTSAWLPVGLALIWLLCAPAGSARAQSETPTTTATPTPVAILSPLPNAAVQGIVPIQVRVDFQDVQSAELTFAYSGDPAETWFFISQSDGPGQNGKLADWDTTTLTDGNYTLRLLVRRTDGSRFTALAANVRVRNYSPIETDTPTPSPTTAPGETPEPTITSTPRPTTIPPTPTPLPANPLQLSTGAVASGFLRGAGTAVTFFALLGLYASLRRFLRK